MRASFRDLARLAVLSMALICGARAQEPVRPEQPKPVSRAAAPAVDPRRAPDSPPPGPGSLTLDATAIRGNQELPKVLYIVPWKDPAMASLAGRPVNSLVEEVLAPVDREVFRRQTRYFGQLYGAGSAAPAAAVPDGRRDAAGSDGRAGQ